MKRTLGSTRLGAALVAITVAVAAGLPTAALGNTSTRAPIVFNGEDANGVNQLLIMDGDGSNRRVLVNDKYAATGVLSPDGTRVAYTSNTPTPAVGQTGVTGGVSLFVAPLAGGTGQPIFQDAAYATPDWSPDGRSILFAVDKLDVHPHVGSLPPGPDQDEIWSVDADGSNAHLIGHGRGPRWAPGGGAILFTDDEGHGVFVMDADGQNVRQLVSPSEFPFVSAPSWSPDGRIVAVRSGPDLGAQLEVMNGDGTARHVIYTDPAPVSSPSWSPDGRTIAFTRNVAGHSSIWTIRPDGTNLVRVSTAEDDHFPRYPSFGK